jgi:hypothetical protein
MILRFLFFFFLFYLAWKLIFDFILPIVRTTRQVKRGFREMNERMNGAGSPFGQQPGQPKPGTMPKQEPKTGGGDYIEFEEIKD